MAETHVGTAFITILPDTEKFAATLIIQMKGVTGAAENAGDEAVKSAINWEVLGEAIKSAGENAVETTGDYVVLGRGMASATDEASDLTRALAEVTAARGAAGLLGGPPGKGIATDLGSAFNFAAVSVQGLLGFLTLVAPTINIIIAALVGVVSLLGAAAIAAAGFAAAITATAAAMGVAAFRWRDLLSTANEDAETWKGALIAIEAEAFNMDRALVKSFSDVGAAGSDLWTTIGEAGVRFLRMMQPFIEGITERITNFIAAFSGEGGATSPFLDFLRRWLQEWKVLGDIINRDIAGGGGLLGFFEKYEAPAKAFVEGIAEVINALRKMSALGLGLNMDQLAQLIRNVFKALAQLVQVFPKFSNALVKVGLQVSEFIVDLLPIISTAIEIGAAILQHIVSPIVEGLIKALDFLMNLPIVSFLISLAGGFGLVALAIAKLSFGSLQFTQILNGMYQGFLSVSRVAGNLLAPALEKVGIQSGSMFANMAGGIVTVGLLAAAMFVLVKGMNEVADMQRQVDAAFKGAFAEQLRGATTAVNTLATTYNKLQTEFNDLSAFGKIAFAFTHLDAALSGQSETMVLTREAAEDLSAAYDDIAEGATAAIATGSFTDAQVQGLDQLRQGFKDYQAVLGGKTLSEVFGLTQAPGQSFDDFQTTLRETLGTAITASNDYIAVQQGLDKAFQDGTINAGQYATMLEQLSGGIDSTGEKVNLLKLQVEGASLTIAQALVEVQKAGDTATGTLRQFAEGSGQEFVALKTDALEALNDVQGGLLGTGAKVTEFFQKQADVIAQWRADTADSFNFVKEAFTGLASQASVSFASIKSTLQDAVQSAADYTKNLNLLIRGNATPEVVQMFKDAGPAAGEMLAAWVSQGRSGIADLNKLVRRGGEQAVGITDLFGDALGVTMENLTTAIELMVARTLGVPFKRIQERVSNIVSGVNDETGKLKDRKVKITFETAKQQQIRSAIAGATGAPAKTPLPLPDPAVYRSKAQEVGQAVGTGYSTGIANQAGTMNAAAAKAGTDSIDAMRKSIGAQSPATAFVAIGNDMIAGVMQGIANAGPRLYNAMFNLGQQAMAGFRQGVLTKVGDAKAAVTAAVQDVIDAAKNALVSFSPSRVFYDIGVSVGEGMRLGVRDSMRRVAGDMPGHIRAMTPPDLLMRHGSVATFRPALPHDLARWSQQGGAYGGAGMHITGELSLTDESRATLHGAAIGEMDAERAFRQSQHRARRRG